MLNVGGSNTRRLDIFAEVAEDGPCAIVVTNPDGEIQHVNATLTRWLGLLPDTVEGQLKFPELLTLPGKMYYETHIAPMMRLQGFVREISCALSVPDGPALPVLMSGVARRDADGEYTRFDYTIFDARERRVYEEELRIARRNADELAAIVRSSPDTIVRVNNAGTIGSWNAGAERLIGQTADEVLSLPVDQIIELDRNSNWFEQALMSCTETGTANFEAKTIHGHDVEITVAPINEESAAIDTQNWSVVLRDITQRKKTERHLQVVVEEMKHRVKNTLSVVSGIARQTLPADAMQKFNARLQALSSAHDALVQTNSSKAELRTLLRLTADEAGGVERCRISGPDVWLSPQQAASLSMAFHELVTNALKYGALSQADGFVQLDFNWEGEANAKRLRLVWQELNGPPVTPPTRQGFGTKMITRVLKVELSAEVTFEFLPEGFRFELAFVPG
tara:strand:+ start:231 stop:1580 length:1350 start_codon:yes stop_codon:yes gene_type:complete